MKRNVEYSELNQQYTFLEINTKKLNFIFINQKTEFHSNVKTKRNENEVVLFLTFDAFENKMIEF